MVTKFAFVACFAGAAMLITALLPHDKMEKVRSFMGDTEKDENPRYAKKPPVRVQLLVCGAAFLFIGLVMLRVIRL